MGATALDLAGTSLADLDAAIARMLAAEKEAAAARCWLRAMMLAARRGMMPALRAMSSA